MNCYILFTHGGFVSPTSVPLFEYYVFTSGLVAACIEIDLSLMSGGLYHKLQDFFVDVEIVFAYTK